MNCSLRQLLKKVEHELDARRHRAAFNAARPIHPALEPCDTPRDVVARLRNTSDATNEERVDLTRALLAQLQANQPSTLWSALLLVAFCPMLIRVRSRLRTNALSDDELDHVVIDAFLHIAQTMDLDSVGVVCLQLRFGTAKHVFRHVNAQEHAAATSDTNAVEQRLLTAQEETMATSDTEAATTARVRLNLLHNMLEPAKLDLVRTYETGTPLRNIVAQANPNASPDEVERLYQRQKRARTRARTQVRQEAARHEEE